MEGELSCLVGICPDVSATDRETSLVKADPRMCLHMYGHIHEHVFSCR